MSEPNPTVCFVEGFRFKSQLEALQNNMSVIRALQGSLLTPQQKEAVKEMEQTIRKQIKSLPEMVKKCASPELENNITWSASMLERSFDKRNWRDLEAQFIYLEATLEEW